MKKDSLNFAYDIQLGLQHGHKNMTSGLELNDGNGE